MMPWYDDHMSGWGYALMGVSTLVFWALIITAIVLLVRYLGSTGGGTTSPTAEQLLAERFARGEIGAEEYRRRLGTLRSGATAGKH